MLPGNDYRKLWKFFSIALVISIVLPLSGCTRPPVDTDIVKTTLNLDWPHLEPRLTDTTTVYDATIDIRKITPNGTIIMWSGVSMDIEAIDGSVLLGKTSLREDTSSYGVNVEVWFSDEVGDRVSIDVGDRLIISGMDDSSYEGASFKVIYKGDRIGGLTLTTDFP